MADVAAAVGGGATISTGASGSVVQPDLKSPGGPSGVQGGGVVPSDRGPVDWTSGFSEDHKAFVTNKGFKGASDVIDSYKGYESLMGAKDKLVRLPDKADAPEWGEVYDKLGRPKTASEYTFKLPDGLAADPANTKFAQELFHKAGLTKAQAVTVANSWNANEQAKSAEVAAKASSNLKAEQSALQTEWGAAWEQNRKACAAAMQSFGLDGAAVTKLESALGYSATMKFLASIGSKVGEASFVTGDNSGFKGALTPDQAKQSLNQKTQDPAWVAKAMS